jgi:tellurite resistance protein TerA
MEPLAMTVLSPGANAPLPSGDLTVLIRHGTIPGAEVDVSALLVTGTGKVRSDADMCFYGQPSVAGGALALAGASGGETRFTVDPGRIPAEVEKIVFTVTIHENRASFGQVKEIGLDIGGVLGRIPCAGMTETALILAELYQRNGAWKVRVVGQGFNGGLAKLAPHLGVEVAEQAHAPAPPKNAPKSASEPSKAEPTPPPVVSNSPVRLTKVTLDKNSQATSINLAKDSAGKLENIKVTLAWTAKVDLDLHAFYRLKNGKTGQVFFASKGALDKAPFIKLDRDMGVGNTGGDNKEALVIGDLSQIDCIIFATNIFRFFGRSKENFARYDGRVILTTSLGEVTVPLTSEMQGSWAVIAKVENKDQPVITNINQILERQPELKDF